MSSLACHAKLHSSSSVISVLAASSLLRTNASILFPSARIVLCTRTFPAPADVMAWDSIGIRKEHLIEKNRMHTQGVKHVQMGHHREICSNNWFKWSIEDQRTDYGMAAAKPFWEITGYGPDRMKPHEGGHAGVLIKERSASLCTMHGDYQ